MEARCDLSEPILLIWEYDSKWATIRIVARLMRSKDLTQSKHRQPSHGEYPSTRKTTQDAWVSTGYQSAGPKGTEKRSTLTNLNGELWAIVTSPAVTVSALFSTWLLVIGLDYICGMAMPVSIAAVTSRLTLNIIQQAVEQAEKWHMERCWVYWTICSWYSHIYLSSDTDLAENHSGIGFFANHIVR